MKLGKIGIIIAREYGVRVKKKSFILTTIITPLLMGLMIVIPVLIAANGEDKGRQVTILDESGIMRPYFQTEGATEYIFAAEGTDLATLKDHFPSLNSFAILHISPLDSNSNAVVTAYSKEPMGLEMKSDIKNTVEKALRDNKLRAYQIDNLDDILSSVESHVSINAITLTDGGEKKDSVEVYMILSYLLSFLIYLFVLLFGNMVMRGVIEEKTNRIVEVVISSVSSFELMMGKIIGVALVALTQFVIWIVLMFGIVTAVSAFAGPTVAESAITAMADAEQAPGVDMAIEGNMVGDILSQVSQINFPYIIGCFLIYFLLGYLLYASMFAAVGAAVDNEADTGQLSMPVTIPLILGIFIMLHTFQHPSSQLSFWASIIPFTSPMVMLARIPFGVVPAWQLILSIAILLATFVGITYISAKIYRIGILTYGKKATFKDLFKWMKSKN